MLSGEDLFGGCSAALCMFSVNRTVQRARTATSSQLCCCMCRERCRTALLRVACSLLVNAEVLAFVQCTGHPTSCRSLHTRPSSSSLILLSCVLPSPDIPSVSPLTTTGPSPFFAPKCILQRASSTLMSLVHIMRTSSRRCIRSRSSRAARLLHEAQALSRRRE